MFFFGSFPNLGGFSSEAGKNTLFTEAPGKLFWCFSCWDCPSLNVILVVIWGKSGSIPIRKSIQHVEKNTTKMSICTNKARLYFNKIENAAFPFLQVFAKSDVDAILTHFVISTNNILSQLLHEAWQNLTYDAADAPVATSTLIAN